MSYIVFARKYRPDNFDDVVGQEHVATTLKNAIVRDRIAHAYLFSGPRGVGKTTMARILAKALNCEKGPSPKPCNNCVACREISSGSSMDVIEIDGASNRGIDEVRQLRENVKFAPTSGRYKLYIIDEVHMLTQEAFNALLKTLEEPPAHVKFIFATTEANKVIATVLSRCQRFDFRRISVADIVKRLKEIAKDESIEIDGDALFSIARQAEGSLRDAQSILDQLNTFCKGSIKKEDIAHVLGVVSQEMLEEFADILIKRDSPGALKFVADMINRGKDPSFFLSNIIEYFRNLIIIKTCGKKSGELVDLSMQSIEKLTKQSDEFTQEELFYISNILISAYESARRSASPRAIFELAVVKITKRSSLTSLNEIMNRLEIVQKKVESGIRDNVSRAVPMPQVKPAIAQVMPPEPPKAAEEMSDPVENNTKTEIPPTVAADDINITKIEHVWPTLLKVLKSKKMSLASYLLESKLCGYDNGLITIGFPKDYSLHREALERQDNRMLVESILEDILQRKIRIAFVIHDFGKENSGSGGNGPGASELSNKEILNEPAIQSALEVFEGRVVRRGK